MVVIMLIVVHVLTTTVVSPVRHLSKLYLVRGSSRHHHGTFADVNDVGIMSAVSSMTGLTALKMSGFTKMTGASLEVISQVRLRTSHRRCRDNSRAIILVFHTLSSSELTSSFFFSSPIALPRPHLILSFLVHVLVLSLAFPFPASPHSLLPRISIGRVLDPHAHVPNTRKPRDVPVRVMVAVPGVADVQQATLVKPSGLPVHAQSHPAPGDVPGGAEHLPLHHHRRLGRPVPAVHHPERAVVDVLLAHWRRGAAPGARAARAALFADRVV